MNDDEVRAFLDGRHVLNVATFNHDATIHLVAMWYGFLDGDIVFETFAKSQKVQNLRRDGVDRAQGGFSGPWCIFGVRGVHWGARRIGAGRGPARTSGDSGGIPRHRE